MSSPIPASPIPSARACAESTTLLQLAELLRESGARLTVHCCGAAHYRARLEWGPVPVARLYLESEGSTHAYALISVVERAFAAEAFGPPRDADSVILYADVDGQDGAVGTCSLREFCDANEDTPEVVVAARGLAVGESVEVGGGASPRMLLTRAS